MGLETGTYVDDLVAANPVGATDDIKIGDDHIRLIKSVLKVTFPNATKAFRFETVLTKTTTYPVVAADDRAVILCNATSGAFTVTLPLLSAVNDGFTVWIIKIDSSANAVTVDGNGAETLNGSATKDLSLQYSIVKVFAEASEWFGIFSVSDPVTLTGTETLTNKTLTTTGKLQADDVVATPAGVITSSSNAVALSMTGANKKTLTLDENTTITVSGEVADQVVELWIKQGSSGGTAAWSGVDQWIGGSAPTLSTTNGQRDIIILASETDGSTIIAQHLGVAS